MYHQEWLQNLYIEIADGKMNCLIVVCMESSLVSTGEQVH